MNNLSQAENEKMNRLNQVRQVESLAKAAAGGPAAKAKLAMSFSKKLSKHWLILVAALFFDLLALIPFLSVVFNFLFGLVLYLYFGPKRIWKGIILPLGIGSVFDFFLSIIPANTATALIRIALSDNG